MMSRPGATLDGNGGKQSVCGKGSSGFGLFCGISSFPLKNMFLLLLLTAVLVSGCSPFTPAPREPLPEGIPEQFTLYPDSEEADGGAWWESFNSPELNRLVNDALGGNFTLREAWARLDRARWGAVKAGAALNPELNVNSDLSRNDARNSGHTSSLSLGLGASYEMDLWGRLSALQTSAELSGAAARADLEAAAMTVAAEVASNWVDLIATRNGLALLGKQVETNETLVRLQELRFEKSMGSVLEVMQQREVLERSRAAIPPVKAQERELLFALAFLMGKAPGTDLGIGDAALPELLPVPPAGLPADLLAMRPDIRAAGLRVSASDWDVAAARANRLPAINLTGSFGYSGVGSGILLDQWVSSLAGSLASPLFDGGHRKAEVEEERALVTERLATYEKTVFTALREVEGSLVNEQQQLAHVRGLEKALEAARGAYAEAGTRYDRGVETFLPMLIELRSVQELERELVRQRAALIKFRIGLHRALGGNWTEKALARPPENAAGGVKKMLEAGGPD